MTDETLSELAEKVSLIPDDELRAKLDNLRRETIPDTDRDTRIARLERVLLIYDELLARDENGQVL